MGGTINLGIEKCNGVYTCITMADLSDDFEDLKKYYYKISKENLDAVFGSRFMKNTKVLDYPLRKLILNSIVSGSFFLSIKVIAANPAAFSAIAPETPP